MYTLKEMMVLGCIFHFQRRADTFLSLTKAVAFFCCILVVPDIMRMAIGCREKQQDLCQLKSPSSITVVILYGFHVLNTLLNIFLFFAFSRKFKAQCFRELTSWGCGRFFARSAATVRPAPERIDLENIACAGVQAN